MAKLDSHFKLSKSAKRVMSGIADKHLRGHFKRMMLDAELTAKSNSRFTMMYDVQPNGARPRKAKESFDPSQNTQLKINAN